MRTGHLLFSAVQFLFVIALLCLGVMGVVLAYRLELRFLIAEFFLGSGTGMMVVGIFFLVLGLVMLFGFYAMYKGRYLQVEMEGVEVELSVVQRYVELYWESAFPGERIASEVALCPRDRRIEVSAALPPFSVEQQEACLRRVEEELGELLREKLGYRREFVLNLHRSG